jgi:hypothetical protein
MQLKCGDSVATDQALINFGYVIVCGLLCGVGDLERSEGYTNHLNFT